MGIPLGLQKVTLGLKTFRFAEPEAVALAIQKNAQLSAESMARLNTYLAQDLQRNDQHSCSSAAPQVNCDYLSTSALDAIYNDLNAQILLFSDPALFQKKSLSAYTTPTQNNVENGLIHQQSINFISSETNKAAYASGTGSLGVDDLSYVVMDWNASRNQTQGSTQDDATLNSLYYRRDIDAQHYGQLGRMDASDLSSRLGGGFSFNFFPALELEGLRVGKAFAYKQQNEDQLTDPLSLILVNSARVEVYKSNKLLGTYYLRPGPNAINTQQFPAGDYVVTLKVYEGDQLVRTEDSKVSITRGRNKENESAWFWQAGKANTSALSDTASRDWATQLGYGLTFLDHYYVSAAVGAQSQSTYGELSAELNKGMNFLASELSLKNAFYFDAHARGNAQSLGLSNEWGSANLTRQKLTSPDCTGLSQPSSYLSCYESLSAFVGFSVFDISLNLGYTRALSGTLSLFDSPGSPSNVRPVSESYQLMANRSFFMGDYNVMLGGGFFRNSTLDSTTKGMDRGAFVNITFSANTPGNLYYSLSQRTQQSNQSGTSKNADVFLRKQWDEQSKDVSLSATDYQQSSSNLHSRNLSLSGQMRSAHGNYYATVSETQQLGASSGASQRTLSGAYSSTLALTSEGLFIGPYGQGRASGAVLAQSSGNDAQSEFTLMAGGYKSTLASGNTALLPVTEYQNTLVNVNTNTESGRLSFDQTQDSGQQEIFLLPGKVNKRHIYTRRTLLLFVKQFTLNAKPITALKVKDVDSYSFYPNGQAALQIKSDQTSFKIIIDGGEALQCAVPSKLNSSTINFIEAMTCQSSRP